jgi:hypothetical protein
MNEMTTEKSEIFRFSTRSRPVLRPIDPPNERIVQSAFSVSKQQCREPGMRYHLVLGLRTSGGKPLSHNIMLGASLNYAEGQFNSPLFSTSFHI